MRGGRSMKANWKDWKKHVDVAAGVFVGFVFSQIAGRQVSEALGGAVLVLSIVIGFGVYLLVQRWVPESKG
jgi:hypothetical protein